MLWLLLLIPVLIALYIILQQRRQQSITHLSSHSLIRSTLPTGANNRRHIPPIFYILALTVLVLGLARPQAVVSLPRLAGTVILAFDVSGSMAADDLEPTRMDAAKVVVEDFIESQPATVQIGVVAFSDNGFSVQTPTNDEEMLLAAIDRLSPERGTSLANGMMMSLDAIRAASGQTNTNYYGDLSLTPEPTPTPMPRGMYAPAVIILLTDGENNQSPDPFEIAQMAADRGVRIYTVGIGSPQGTEVHINGFTVHTELDEATLQQISQITAGTYFHAENEEELREIYDTISSQLVVKPQEMEVTSLIAGVGILFFLVGAMFSLLWFGRVP
ncbi:MAG: VWA domain-containing protein [Anaerolineae bacterium]|nr:VWA domain-containing protein [Anaerolineae bacterium]